MNIEQDKPDQDPFLFLCGSDLEQKKRIIQAYITERYSNHYVDGTLGLTWDVKDYDKILHDYYHKIWHYERTRNIELKHKAIMEMERDIERSLNDQTSPVEPIDITFKYDKIVNAGRSRASKLIAGEADSIVSPIVKNTATFDFYAIGTGRNLVTDSDFALDNEIPPRINLRLQGFASGPGALIKHNGIFSPGVQTVTVWESGQFDTPEFNSRQAMWSRSIFPSNKPLEHFQNQDFFTITHTVFTTSSA